MGVWDCCFRPAQAKKKFVRSHLKGKKLEIMAYTCHFNKDRKRRIAVQASPGQNRRPYLHIIRKKRARGLAQVVERLPSKHQCRRKRRW
jgi:hypothetical protein